MRPEPNVLPHLLVGRLTKNVEFNVRDQRTFRCAERSLVVDARFGAFAPASVCAKAAVVTLRLRSSRHSACVPLFRSPNRKSKCDDAIALTRLYTPLKHHFSWHALRLTFVSDFADESYPMSGRNIYVFHPKSI